MRAFQRRGRNLAQTEVTRLAFFDKFRHRADRILNRNLRVDAVQVVKVDSLDAESFETALDSLAGVFGPAVNASDSGVVGVAHDAELGGQKHLITLPLDCATDQLFIGVWPVYIRCVQKIDAEFQRAVNSFDGFSIITIAVKFAHAHAAESDGRNLRAVSAKASPLHMSPPLDN